MCRTCSPMTGSNGASDAKNTAGSKAASAKGCDALGALQANSCATAGLSGARCEANRLRQNLCSLATACMLQAERHDTISWWQPPAPPPQTGSAEWRLVRGGDKLLQRAAIEERVRMGACYSRPGRPGHEARNTRGAMSGCPASPGEPSTARTSLVRNQRHWKGGSARQWGTQSAGNSI